MLKVPLTPSIQPVSHPLMMSVNCQFCMWSMMLSEFEDRYVDSVLYMLQELADREELQRQQEEYRLQQEQLERQRLEQERIAQELEDKRRVCCRVSVVKLHGSLRTRGGYVVEFYLYPTVGTVLIHSVKPELTE